MNVTTRYLPAALLALLDDLGMVDADVAVERHGRANLVAVEHLHQPEHAHAVAVIANGPGRNVRNLAGSEAARPRFKREELDVRHDP